MSFTDALSKLGQVLPAVKKPEQKPSLNQKLLWSIVGVIVYLVMSSVPLYGIQSSALSNFLLEQVIFASTAGTLAQLGIGPIITAGLIMQILVGSKLINLNLSTEDDKAKFTEAQKGLAFLFILLESFLFGFALTRSTGFSNLTIPLAVAGQLVVATYFILLLDELIQKGWGLGSGVSLFILAGTMKIIFWYMFGIVNVQSQNLPVGFFPSLVTTLIDHGDILTLIVNTTKPFQPDLVGLVTTIGLIFLIIYLTSINVQIPITSQRVWKISCLALLSSPRRVFL